MSEQIWLWLAWGETEWAAHWARHLVRYDRSIFPLAYERQEVALIRVLLAQREPDAARAHGRASDALQRMPGCGSGRRSADGPLPFRVYQGPPEAGCLGVFLAGGGETLTPLRMAKECTIRYVLPGRREEKRTIRVPSKFPRDGLEVTIDAPE